MKNKQLIKGILGITGAISICIPFAIQKDIFTLNQVSSFLNTYQTTQANNNSILSDDVQDINQATQNGFIGKTTNTVFSSNFYGENLWTYDLTNSKFLVNSDGTQKNVKNFFVKYNSNNETVAVIGSYTDKNNFSQSFFFQLHASTGLPYFSNESPSLSEQEKYSSSIITSENNQNLIKNPTTVIFDNDYATIFNENVLSDPNNNKPVQINVLTLDTIQLSFDSSFLNGIKISYTSNIFLGATILADGNILVTTGAVDSSNKISYIRVFLLDSTLKSIFATASNGQVEPSRLTLVSSSSPNSGYIQGGIYEQNQVLRDIVVTGTSDANLSKITFTFVGKSSVFRQFSYNKTTHILTLSGTKYLSDADGSAISYLTKDTANKKIYYTTTTTNKTLMAYDVENNTISTLSADEKFSGAKLSSFLTSTSSSQIVLNKAVDGKQVFYGFQLNVGGNSQGIIEIKIPQIENYKTIAQANNLYNEMPQDVTEQQAINVLKLSNYNANEYSVSLKSGTLFGDNNLGTLKFTLNLSIAQWWNKVANKQFVIEKEILLDGFPTTELQKFELVTNASINATKYNEVYQLQQSIYLSDLTKQNVLDYFINYGSNIKLTTSDISLNNDIQDAQIKVSTNNQTGLLTIDYNIKDNENKSSLLDSYKTGSATWQFNKKLDNYKQLVLNNVLFSNYKSTKYPGDVTLDDLITLIDFSLSGTGYSTDVNRWEWIPTNPVGSQEWVEEQLEGILTGTLKYIRSSDEPSSDIIPDSNLELKIDSSIGYGFKQLKSFILGDLNSSGEYDNQITINQSLADSLTATSNKKETIENLKEILNQTLLVKNSWISIDNLVYSIDESKSTDVRLYVNVSIPNNAKTNISFNDSGIINLNKSWVNSLEKLSPKIFSNYEFVFNMSVATFSWNIAKANFGSEITINDINSKELNKYHQKLPSTLVNDLSSNFHDFQKITNLLNLSNSVSIETESNKSLQGNLKNSDNGSFIVQSIQLTPNDEIGTITASYTLVYPNLNNVSKVASITIKGFLSVWDIIIFWIIIVVVIAIICISIWLIVSYAKKNHKKKRIWSTHDFVKNFKKAKNSFNK
ncbi:MAG: hypothetical protein HDR31_01935 [Mycoplasma sp.]|nr:hypothetical protein [Mycoplasma sp.]